MRTHVYFSDDEAGLLVDIKSPVPLPIRSATRDLFTFCSPHERFRTASDTRQAVMVVLCVLATCAIATWELHAVLRFFWFCVLKLTLFALTVELEGLKTPEEKMELRMALSGSGKYA
jgi:endonuclease/exonuclease/phosphatase (EEP) superfamily protein YafD